MGEPIQRVLTIGPSSHAPYGFCFDQRRSPITTSPPQKCKTELPSRPIAIGVSNHAETTHPRSKPSPKICNNAQSSVICQKSPASSWASSSRSRQAPTNPQPNQPPDRDDGHGSSVPRSNARAESADTPPPKSPDHKTESIARPWGWVARDLLPPDKIAPNSGSQKPRLTQDC